jgi:hypothetical protein
MIEKQSMTHILHFPISGHLNGKLKSQLRRSRVLVAMEIRLQTVDESCFNQELV